MRVFDVTFERKVSATKKQLASLLLVLTMALVVTSGLAVPAYAADSDFEIENGVLKKYTGASVDVVIPDGVTIPEGVEVIDFRTFEGCRQLTELKLPSTIKVVDFHAFSSCSGLTEVTFPAGLTEIGDVAFEGCTNLKTATILGANTIIKSNAFPLTTTIRGWRGSDAERYAKAAETTNTGAQNYNAYHADPIRSYLYQRGDGNFTRVEWPKYQSYVVGGLRQEF